LAQTYDLILIDTNPSFSFLNHAAISVSDAVLSPVTPDHFAIRGIRLVRTTLSYFQPKAGVTRFIAVNQYDANSTHDRKFFQDLLGGVYDPKISAGELLLEPGESRNVLSSAIPKSGFMRATKTSSRILAGLNDLRAGKIRNALHSVSKEIIERLEIAAA
jgi:cellulose biosynthesis protein BcsQ